MSRIKRFLENVSEKHGYGGEINDEVLKLGQIEMERLVEQAEHEMELQRDQEADDFERDQEDSNPDGD